MLEERLQPGKVSTSFARLGAKPSAAVSFAPDNSNLGEGT